LIDAEQAREDSREGKPPQVATLRKVGDGLSGGQRAILLTMRRQDIRRNSICEVGLGAVFVAELLWARAHLRHDLAVDSERFLKISHTYSVVAVVVFVIGRQIFALVDCFGVFATVDNQIEIHAFALPKDVGVVLQLEGVYVRADPSPCAELPAN